MNHLKNELYRLIKEEERVFDFIQESALDGLWFWDLEQPESRWINRKFWDTLGYTPKETIEHCSSLKGIVHPDDFDKLPCPGLSKQQVKEGRLEDTIVRFLHKNGSTIWARCKGLIFENVTTGTTNLLLAHINITQQKNYELQLKDRINQYDHVIQGLGVGTWQWNIQTNKVYFNELWAQTLGYPKEDLENATIDTWDTLILPEDRAKNQELIQEHFNGKTTIFQNVCRIRHKQGHVLWVINRGKVTERDSFGNPMLMTGSTQDITERKKAENALLESNYRNQLFVDQAPSAIAMFDTEMRYLAASQQWLKDYNLGDREIIGKSHYEIFPEIGQNWKDIHSKCMTGVIMRKEEDQFVRLNGSIQWLTWDVRPWYIEQGKVGGLLMYTADITNLKEKEQLLLKYQNLLEKTNEAALIGTWEVELENSFITWSSVTKAIHEVSEDYIPKPEEAALFYKEGYDRDTIRKAVQKCISEGQSFDLELQIVTAKGQQKWVRTIGIPFTEDGKVIRLYGLFQDIDEKTRATRKLAIQEEQFRQTFEFAPNGMALVGLNGEWLEVNKSLCDILGYSKEELLNITFQDITHPDDLTADLALMKELLAGERKNYQMEKRYIHKQGQEVWGLLSVSMVKNYKGEPSHFVSQINNITQGKIVKIQLEQSLNRLQGIQDASTQVSIIETNSKGKILSFNKGAENLLGYTAEELVGKSTLEVLHREYELIERSIQLTDELEENVDKLESILMPAKKGLFESREWTYVRKDGTSFPVLLTVTAIRNKENSPVGFLGIATDITSLKTAESEIKSLLDVTKEQNERLLNFAHIVSHNLRSHSGNLSMLIDLMKMETPEVTNNDFFPLLIQASDNLKETIGHLNEVVAMNAKTKENLLPLNLKEYVDKAITNMNLLVLETKAIIENNVDESVHVMAIPAYLDSILFNLLNNAIKYRSPQRVPHIKVSSKKEWKFQSIEVTDNGLGIDLKLYGTKLFGMYKTFHGNIDARGVGLFITKNQIETMGGHIAVESEIDKGTTFKVQLIDEEN